jgi:hypothetical protein
MFISESMETDDLVLEYNEYNKRKYDNRFRRAATRAGFRQIRAAKLSFCGWIAEIAN